MNISILFEYEITFDVNTSHIFFPNSDALNIHDNEFIINQLTPNEITYYHEPIIRSINTQ